MSESREKSGILVYPMPEEVGGPRISGQYALLIKESDAGVELRMVHTEGVAYKVSSTKPWCWTDYSDTPRKWSPIELLAYVFNLQERFIEPVDLADWVRTFGARLESNYAQIVYWYNQP